MSDNRNIHQQRDTGAGCYIIAGHQSAEQDSTTVFQRKLGINFARADGGGDRNARGGGLRRAHFLLNFEFDAVTGMDHRLDVQDHTDTPIFHRLQHPCHADPDGGCLLAGDDRHLLSDLDGGTLAITRQNAGTGENTRAIIVGERIERQTRAACRTQALDRQSAGSYPQATQSAGVQKRTARFGLAELPFNPQLFGIGQIDFGNGDLDQRGFGRLIQLLQQIQDAGVILHAALKDQAIGRGIDHHSGLGRLHGLRGLSRQCLAQPATQQFANRRGQLFRIGIARVVSEETASLAGRFVQFFRPVDDVLDDGGIAGKHDDGIDRLHRHQNDGLVGRGGSGGTIPLRRHNLVQLIGHFLRRPEHRVDARAVLAAHPGLIEHMDGFYRGSDIVGLSADHQRVARAILLQVEFRPVHLGQPGSHFTGHHRIQLDQLKHRAQR